jgi:hypothetical protein
VHVEFFVANSLKKQLKTINAETISSVGASFFAALFAMFAGMTALLRGRKDNELSFAF